MFTKITTFFRSLISLLLALTLVLIPCTVAGTIVEPIDYSTLTTEQLLDEVLNHPSIAELLLFSSNNAFYDYVKTTNTGLVELESRSDAPEIIASKYLQLKSDYSQTANPELELQILFIRVLLGVEEYKSNVRNSYATYTDSERSSTVREANGINYTLTDIEAYTLSNNKIDLYYTDETISDYSFALTENYIYRHCGEISKIHDHDVHYNCHSYAWYQRSPINQYWIFEITPYLSDPHYMEVTKSTAEVGDVVVYFNEYQIAVHSAVITNITMSSIFIPNILCHSKFGASGVYEHYVDNVIPDYTANGTASYKIFRYTTSHDYVYTQYNASSHARTCEHCGTEYLSHNKTVTTKTGLNHTLKCYDCGWTRTEAHSYPSGSQKCKTCGYNNNGHNTASVEITPIP